MKYPATMYGLYLREIVIVKVWKECNHAHNIYTSKDSLKLSAIVPGSLCDTATAIEMTAVEYCCSSALSYFCCPDMIALSLDRRQ